MDATLRGVQYAERSLRAGSLDELVTVVATRLMGVDSRSLRPAAESVLRTLVDHFGVDLSFLRFHDAACRTTELVAEWPPRDPRPDPDPLGVVAFEDADAAFAASEHLADIMIIRPDAGSSGYQRRVRAGSGVAATSSATVPLRSAERTTGILGFVKYGDRGWSDDELRALRTIALLLAQMQGRMQAEDRLRHLAHHDELTGLPNRRALLDHLRSTLDAAVAAGGDTRRALLFVDVDRLKAMNDFLGHEAGDRYIVTVAERLGQVSGADGTTGDLVARLGGDEFVVAVAGPADEARATGLAERVRRAMAEPVRIGGQTLGRTVSVGVAVADVARTGIVEWMRSADQAVLAAKEHGGNSVVVFTDEMRAAEEMRVAIEMNLPSAIRDGLLAVYFQPAVDLRTRRVVGAEALLRWNHPTLGPVPPEVFVGVAEATNLAGELGAWVLGEACRQVARSRDRADRPDLDEFTISVNVSPVQLIATDFVATVADALARHGLSGGQLVLEVTEHAVVADEAALATLHGLRALGVGIAIDDFGTGYSSLAQLKALPVTTLKIDRGFVRWLGESADDLAIVRSIVRLADSFSLELVAEGVETEVAAETLLGLGCHLAQGHLFSRAVPAERLFVPDGHRP